MPFRAKRASLEWLPVLQSELEYNRQMVRRTTSETEFETFLSENNLPFEPIEIGDSPRPDYLVTVGEMKVFFEVKEIAEDANFKTGHLQVSSRIIGDHVRARIQESKKQVQFGARQGAPSVLLIYNNLDPIHLFGTENHDFIAAMYGAYTVVLKHPRMLEASPNIKAVDYVHGKDQYLQENKNTSFSALGRLYPVRGKLEVTLFENVFAKVRLPFDTLPSCFDVKRFEISHSKYGLKF
ncbi:MAG TPA: hypothetical protein VFR24_26195 [Candidatus Angelobacter sp.]|nr:hypothetical protein [Candidatus Angelobacter sp.]